MKSEPGHGSVFHFTVPFETQKTLPQLPNPIDLEMFRGFPVLIADDNATNRTIVRETLADLAPESGRGERRKTGD